MKKKQTNHLNVLCQALKVHHVAFRAVSFCPDFSNMGATSNLHKKATKRVTRSH